MGSHEIKDVVSDAPQVIQQPQDIEMSAPPTATGDSAEASHQSAEAATGDAAAPSDEAAKPMSKNALKRLRRQQEWEDGREDRRKRRREKRHDRKVRVRGEREALLAQGADPVDVMPKLKQQQQRAGSVRAPVALIVDCDFERYMNDKELISLASQVTRCYSDNRNAPFRAHLWVAGWAGKLRERFRGALHDQQRHWKGVGFVEGDFLACADEARRQMAEKPGEMIASLQRSRQLLAQGGGENEGEGESEGKSKGKAGSEAAWTKDDSGAEPYPLPGPDPELDPAHRDVVYLTSESPYTLQRLEPNTCYVIGGLVDKNREKGLCYRRARERGVRTARLPIGQFMQMQSRQVLATNHVVDIMLKWLEYEDWGQAFVAVIPKRKGGKLIGDDDDEETNIGAEKDDAPEDDVDPKDEGNGEAAAAAAAATEDAEIKPEKAAQESAEASS